MLRVNDFGYCSRILPRANPEHLALSPALSAPSEVLEGADKKFVFDLISHLAAPHGARAQQQLLAGLEAGFCHRARDREFMAALGEEGEGVRVW